MVEHQTRLRVLDDNIKSLTESQSSLSDSQNALRRDFDLLVTSFDEQKALLRELVSQRTSSQSSSPAPSPFSASQNSLGQHKPASVQLARFSGINPDRWLMQADRYFTFYNIKDEDRVTIASFYFDEAASDWYDWMFCNRQLAGWHAFSASLLARFGSRDLEEPEGLLAKLHQTTSVDAYRSEFEAVTNRAICLPAHFLVQCFISGLRSDIKHSVLIHRPTTLDDAMQLAQLYERRIILEKSPARPVPTLGTTKPLLPTPSFNPKVHPTASQPPTTQSTATLPIRRLTPSEAAQRRSKGLCYHCDEKYSWDHKCKSKPQLLFLENDSKPTEVNNPLLLPPPHGPDHELSSVDPSSPLQ